MPTSIECPIFTASRSAPPLNRGGELVVPDGTLLLVVLPTEGAPGGEDTLGRDGTTGTDETLDGVTPGRRGELDGTPGGLTGGEDVPLHDSS
jgi:hypothetical protein